MKSWFFLPIIQIQDKSHFFKKKSIFWNFSEFSIQHNVIHYAEAEAAKVVNNM